MRKMRNIFNNIIKKIPLGNYIILESIPICTGNTKAVFDEMIIQKLNQRYKFVWWPSSNPCFGRIDNVMYPNENKKIDMLLFKYYKKRAKCIICENRFVESYRRNQLSFFLGHGTPLKDSSSYYKMPSNIDYFIIASEWLEKIDRRVFCVDDAVHIVALGFPRNDELIAKKIDLNKVFGEKFHKFVGWYPTFRQQLNSALQYSGKSIPIIDDYNTAFEVNELAKELGILIIIKPHFAQDVHYIRNLELSNIRFIDDNFLIEKGINSYGFIGSCDALLTDYSSIYYDYLLCNKPIGMILEDIDKYTELTKLIDEFDYISSAATKIYSLNDFKKFLMDLSNEKDDMLHKREEICKLVNYSNDGKNTERVTRFIISEAGL